MDSKSDSPAVQSLVMMSQGTQGPGMPQSLSMADQPGWNPSRLFEQWNTTFGATEVPTIQDIQAVQATMPTGSHQLSPPQYTAAPVPNFVTPAMWQESVASVYEGGLKRGWDYDGVAVMKRH
ncbi:hypothetical protein NXS19_013989 [Fusarium pseudograminearum]|nr:hypothetical protein NXS19_013989 [Fusarium pseudograminearum]